MDIKELTQLMHTFVTDKGWYKAKSPKPQTPRNLAISLSLEAAEVLELFQWQDATPVPQLLASELADVSLYLLQLASISKIDLEQAIIDKLKVNYRRQWENDVKESDQA